MDYLLPSEETMAKMAKEYSALLKPHTTSAMSCADANLPDAARDADNPPPCAPLLFALYFAFALGYNFGYGNAISDTDGNMGRVQSRKGRDGDFDYFFPRKR